EPPTSDSCVRHDCARGRRSWSDRPAAAWARRSSNSPRPWARRVIAGASTGDEEWVADCGAATVIDTHAEDSHRQVERAAPGGVDVWWDPNGADDYDRSVPLLAQDARVIAMAGMQTAPRLPIGQLYTRDASLLGFAISNASAADLAEAAQAINRMLATGRLRGRVGATFHLAEAAEAHRVLESGGVRGRILILP